MILLLQIILGVFLGVLFGFIPSLHINVIGYLILLIGFFSNQFDFLFFLAFSIAQLITSIIPAIVFGVPTDETINTLFPGQKMFLLGKAKQAIYLCFIGYFLGVFFAILILPILYLLFSLLSSFYILIIFVILFILFLFIYEQKFFFDKLIVMIMILFSGVLGIFTLSYNYFFTEPIFVCIFGLFGAPTLIFSLFSNKKVLQKTEVQSLNLKNPISTSFLGALSSLLVILIPSLSSAQSGLIISKIKKKLTSQEYLVLFSSISISTLIFSFFLSIFFRKSRLGFISLLLSNKIIVPSINIFLFITTILFAMIFSILILVLLLDSFLKFVNKVNQVVINLTILIFSIFLILLISGPTALFLLFLSTSIGFLPLLFNKPRVVLMSYIMFPTLLYFI